MALTNILRIVNIDPITDNIIETFPTLKKAAETMGVSKDAIGKACRKQTKCKLYSWNYA